jgi:NAD-dependent deacetylase
VSEHGSIVILTGAGISAESGVDTFRAADGIWAKYDIEEVATPEAFAGDPLKVNAFYNARRRQLLSGTIGPNPAHRALAELQSAWRGRVTLVTQNIDDLHERAGSTDVLHMHGELTKVRCTDSERVIEWRRDVTPGERCECCGMTGTLRPHVVWFRELPFWLDEATRALRECDLFMAIGTSGQVYPASGFIDVARASGRARTVELNLEPTVLSHLFDENLHGPAGRVVPEFIARLLEQGAGPIQLP